MIKHVGCIVRIDDYIYDCGDRLNLHLRQGDIHCEACARSKGAIALIGGDWMAFFDGGDHKGQEIAPVLERTYGSIRACDPHKETKGGNLFLRNVDDIKRSDFFSWVVLGTLHFRAKGGNALASNATNKITTR